MISTESPVPAGVNFGNLEAGQSASQLIVVSNTGQATANVFNIGLADSQTNGYYSLSGGLACFGWSGTNCQIPGGSYVTFTLTVNIWAPQDVLPSEQDVSFQVDSDADNPDLTVNLYATTVEVQ